MGFSKINPTDLTWLWDFIDLAMRENKSGSPGLWLYRGEAITLSCLLSILIGKKETLLLSYASLKLKVKVSFV